MPTIDPSYLLPSQKDHNGSTYTSGGWMVVSSDAPAAVPWGYREWRQIQKTSDLDHAVFKTPVDTLVSLGIVKFGDGWVDKKNVYDH